MLHVSRKLCCISFLFRDLKRFSTQTADSELFPRTICIRTRMIWCFCLRCKSRKLNMFWCDVACSHALHTSGSCVSQYDRLSSGLLRWTHEPVRATYLSEIKFHPATALLNNRKSGRRSCRPRKQVVALPEILNPQAAARINKLVSDLPDQCGLSCWKFYLRGGGEVSSCHPLCPHCAPNRKTLWKCWETCGGEEMGRAKTNPSVQLSPWQLSYE